MTFTTIEKGALRYIFCPASDAPLSAPGDVLDLIGACFSAGAHFALLECDALGEGFYRLGTGLAGEYMQKLGNYRIVTAVILPAQRKIQGKFNDMRAENNRCNAFRFVEDAQEAEKWFESLRT